MARIKERHFGFYAGGGKENKVVCRHCDWTSRGDDKTPAQVVFDRSAKHECPGVESYASMRARDDMEREADRRRRQAASRA
jgi:hypothetical protein